MDNMYARFNLPRENLPNLPNVPRNLPEPRNGRDNPERGKSRGDGEILENDLPEGRPRQSMDREIREEREISPEENDDHIFSDEQWGVI